MVFGLASRSLKVRRSGLVAIAALLLAAWACAQPPGPPTASPSPPDSTDLLPTPNTGQILIGTEYILIDRSSRMEILADMLGPIGIPAAKPLGEHIEWGAMQSGPQAPVDFSRLDGFVTSFQAAGFTELVLALKSHSAWASIEYGTLLTRNPTPKPEHRAAYAAWIGAVVERYDLDGREDMPGLQHPIRYIEIGSEFSSYEPEPVDEYLAMLEIAYEAAHAASDDVIVAHAAFLTTLAFSETPAMDALSGAFESVPDRSHSLADIRQVLDHPEWFDAANVHALGDPYEVEAIMAWLSYEMGLRGYRKPVIISDTTPAPFVAWGQADDCSGPANILGRIIPPAVEADRCRLADYFSLLISGDPATVEWVQAFVAEDMVKRTVIAAAQGYALINTAFTEDLFWLKLPLARAGAGNSAWAGFVDPDKREYRPAFYAIQQLARHFGNYERVDRLPDQPDGVRVYRVVDAERVVLIAWYDSGPLVLPGDPLPGMTVTIEVDAESVMVERLITAAGQTEPDRAVVSAVAGRISIELSSTPVFILTGDPPGQ